jgi:predicted O-methyltransferase YrrM
LNSEVDAVVTLVEGDARELRAMARDRVHRRGEGYRQYLEELLLVRPGGMIVAHNI